MSIIIYVIISIMVFCRFNNLSGFNYFETPNVYKLILFAGIVFIIGISIPINNSFVTMVVWTVYYMHIFPWIILGAYYMGLKSEVDSIEQLLFIILIGTIYAFIAHIITKNTIRIRSFKMNIKYMLMINVIIILIFTIVVALKLGYSLSIPTYSKIYSQRAIYKSIIKGASGGSIISRALLIITYTILPFTIATASYLIQIKKYTKMTIIITIISIGAGIFVFSLTAYKSAIALTALSFLVPIILRKARRIIRNPSIGFVWLLVLAGVVSLISYLINSDSRWLFHYFRRTFMVPGMQVWFYIDIFPLYPPQFTRDAPMLVSQYVYGTSGSANSGLIGSGLALGGYIGVIVNLIIFSTWLAISRSYTKNIPQEILAPIAIIYGYLFSNSATTTVLFSYGAVLAPTLFAMMSSSLKRINKIHSTKKIGKIKRSIK